MNASGIHGQADHAIRQVAPWVERLARLGFIAKAVLYMTIGVLASAAALRLGGTPAQGQRGAMGALVDAPLGRVLLAVIAAGLFGYAAWRFIDAVTDPEGNGRDAKGIAKRIRSASLGVLYTALGASAVKIALGHREAATDGEQTQHWVSRAMASSPGKVVLIIIAGAFVIYGIHQLYCAATAKLDKKLRLGRMSPSARRWLVAASRFGIAARGIVFGTTGVLVWRAVERRDPAQARGLKTSLLQLFELGRIPFAIIAVGLVAYGVYQLIEARYRNIAVA
ncbi:MAG: DUF1206 domain-containing protein [Kofleriaceae bacterium]|nr:DUF1206 domain-containing protein [Kofleriaceae bacterium]